MSSQLIKSIKKPFITPPRSLSNSIVLNKHMTLFEKTKALPRNLHMLQQTLRTIFPTSVEAKRCFSTAGNTVSMLRNRLSDEVIACLSFLKMYYQKKTYKCFWEITWYLDWYLVFSHYLDWYLDCQKTKFFANTTAE